MPPSKTQIAQGEASRNAILHAIKQHHDWYGYAPTFHELAVAVGLSSKATVHRHIETLSSQGLVDWRPERPRTIVLTTAGLGKIEADRDTATPRHCDIVGRLRDRKEVCG